MLSPGYMQVAPTLLAYVKPVACGRMGLHAFVRSMQYVALTTQSIVHIKLRILVELIEPCGRYTTLWYQERG